MIGIVAGIFLTLLVAGLCSICLKMDLKWYISLDKCAFLSSGEFFRWCVIASYISSIITMSRLVEHKHIFPSMLFFAILGVGCVLFCYCFFTLKNLLLALVFVAVVFSMSLVLFVRFLTKDVRLALCYFVAFLFNSYCFLMVLAIAMAN